ncbi:MAG TPA: hypothetical protein VII06_01175 [Chloroflexota bacterium]|jgi:hypothetical protein
MMLQQTPAEAAPWHWLPTRDAPTRELYVALDGLPAVIGWLADDRFNGAVTVTAGPHELAVLFVDGTPVGAGLRSDDGLPALDGPAALRTFHERAGTITSITTRLVTISRPVVECLTAVLDPQPSMRFIADTTELRDALRELALLGHNGLVDVMAGDQWSRALFTNGRLMGAYDANSPALAPSLAGLGRLAGRPNAVAIVRTVPPAPLPHLEWPKPAPATVSAAEAPPLAANAERDERVETDFLWLLSQVDRDYERALRSGEPETRGLQVLASFTNALSSFAAHLALAQPGHAAPERLPAVIESMRPRYPLVGELELRRDEIDAPALARRFKNLPRDGAFRTDFQRGVSHVLLVLVQQSMGTVIREVGDAAVRQRCMMALETWMGSIEAALPRADSGR